MANIAKVHIKGTLPFHCYNDPKLMAWLAAMNAPTYGLRIKYGDETYVPNNFGGRTSTWGFEITGSEALWQSGVEQLIDSIKSAKGTVTYVDAWDAENMQKMTIKY